MLSSSNQLRTIPSYGSSNSSSSLILPNNPISNLQITTSPQVINTKTITGNGNVFTFDSTPTAGSFFFLEVINTNSGAVSIGVPSSISSNYGGVITGMTIPGSGSSLLEWRYDGSNYRIYNDPTTINDLAADASPDSSSDYMMTWDASTTGHKKVLLAKMVTQDNPSNQSIRNITYMERIWDYYLYWSIDSITSRLRFLIGQYGWIGWNSAQQVNAGGGDIYLSRQSSAVLQCGTNTTNASGGFAAGWCRTTPTNVSSLPSVLIANTGARAFVTDASASMTGIGSIVVGGGSNKVPVYCDGSNWLIG